MISLRVWNGTYYTHSVSRGGEWIASAFDASEECYHPWITSRPESGVVDPRMIALINMKIANSDGLSLISRRMLSYKFK